MEITFLSVILQQRTQGISKVVTCDLPLSDTDKASDLEQLKLVSGVGFERSLF